MGIPYSRQINAAFDQVTPLVQEGFKVLEKTKNISLLLAAIQVITVILLAAILVVLVALLVTVNPQLEQEREEMVTPVVRWVCGVVAGLGGGMVRGFWWMVVGGSVVGLAGGGWGLWETGKREGEAVGRVLEGERGEEVEKQREGEDGEEGKGEGAGADGEEKDKEGEGKGKGK